MPTLECLLSGSSLADSLFKKEVEEGAISMSRIRTVGRSENPEGEGPAGASSNVMGIINPLPDYNWVI